LKKGTGKNQDETITKNLEAPGENGKTGPKPKKKLPIRLRREGLKKATENRKRVFFTGSSRKKNAEKNEHPPFPNKRQGVWKPPRQIVKKENEEKNGPPWEILPKRQVAKKAPKGKGSSATTDAPSRTGSKEAGKLVSRLRS